MWGTKLRCWVLWMALEKSIKSPGIRVKTESMLKQMALMSTRPMSKPRPNCMNIMAAKPEMVVRELEEMAGIEYASAEMQAARSSPSRSHSSVKRWSKMMA